MSAFERHYSVQEVSEMWGYSESTIRKLFADESGVLKIGSPERRFKRKRWVLSVSESTLRRVYERLSSERK
jgi:AraC-like DNA-binding protein